MNTYKKTPSGRRKKGSTLRNRFIKYILIGLDKDKCWEWLGYIDRYGYGCISHGETNRRLRAHRVSWNIFVGSIPDGVDVLHKCDNRKCVNPNHLFLGSHEDNMRDMAQKGRQAQEKTHGMYKHGRYVGVKQKPEYRERK